MKEVKKIKRKRASLVFSNIFTDTYKTEVTLDDPNVSVVCSDTVPFCPKCRKLMEIKQLYTCDMAPDDWRCTRTLPFADAEKFEEPEPVSKKITFLGFSCTCNKKIYMSNYNRADAKQYLPNTMYKKIAFVEKMYAQKASEGIYLSDKGNLSIFTSIVEPRLITRKNGEKSYVLLTGYNRLSVNTQTGDCFIARKDPVYARNNEFRCLSFSHSARAEMGFDRKVEKDFIEILAKYVKVPLKFKFFDRGEFSCIVTLGDSCLELSDFPTTLSMIAVLIKAPNIFIRYDAFKNSYSFRGCNFSTNDYREHLSDRVSLFLPSTVKFRTCQPSEILDEGVYIRGMIDALRIPDSKWFLKTYRENPMMMGLTSYVKSLGIKDPNNMMAFMHTFGEMPYFYKKNEPDVRRFIKDMIRELGENTCVRKILAEFERHSTGEYFIDTIAMYRNFLQRDPEQLPKFAGKTVIEYHNELVKRAKSLDFKNAPIQITANEKKREFKASNGLEVRVADDVNTLKTIGNTMGICVGSAYVTPALNKQCTIYYIVDKNGEYQACIELRKNKAIQFKGYYNRSLEGDAAKCVVEWCERKNIIHKCYDYEQLERNLKLA